MPKEKCFIIAELSANHDGSIERAKQIITAAAEAGADAVKIQTYTADTLTIDCDNKYFQLKDGLWAGRTLYDLYKEASMPWEWTPELIACAQDHGLAFFSTPFDVTAVEYLESLDTPMYKVASFEIVDIPLLRAVGATTKPVIMSTGMASIEEIQEAIDVLRLAGTEDITLLKCTSAYPAQPEDANLLTIPDMAERFGCCIGLSDHTMGTDVAIAAVALGARVIEKHFTLDRLGGGPDDSFSMEPAEFTEMVRAIRVIESALGMPSYGVCRGQEGSLRYRKSIFAVQDIKVGEKFTTSNIRCIRPGDGLHTRSYEHLLGQPALRSIKRGNPLALNDFS